MKYLLLGILTMTLLCCKNSSGGNSAPEKKASAGSPGKGDDSSPGKADTNSELEGVWKLAGCEENGKLSESCDGFSRINYVWKRIESFDGGRYALLVKDTGESSSKGLWKDSEIVSYSKEGYFVPFRDYPVSIKGEELRYCSGKVCQLHEKSDARLSPLLEEAIDEFERIEPVKLASGSVAGHCQPSRDDEECTEVAYDGRVILNKIWGYLSGQTIEKSVDEAIGCQDTKFISGQGCPADRFPKGCQVSIRNATPSVTYYTSKRWSDTKQKTCNALGGTPVNNDN